MAYKIAVASSNGTDLDVHFGAAEQFFIYDVSGTEYHLSEIRKYEMPEVTLLPGSDCDQERAGSGNGCGYGAEVQSTCDSGAGCGNGGCCGAGGRHPKVELVADCRCVVCRKIGFNILKQLEKLAITSFDVDCSVKEALVKIIVYLQKVDLHQSLRGANARSYFDTNSPGRK